MCLKNICKIFINCLIILYIYNLLNRAVFIVLSEIISEVLSIIKIKFSICNVPLQSLELY